MVQSRCTTAGRVYIDDWVIIGTSCDPIKVLKEEMKSIFQISDMGL